MLRGSSLPLCTWRPSGRAVGVGEDSSGEHFWRKDCRLTRSPCEPGSARHHRPASRQRSLYLPSALWSRSSHWPQSHSTWGRIFPRMTSWEITAKICLLLKTVWLGFVKSVREEKWNYTYTLSDSSGSEIWNICNWGEISLIPREGKGREGDW